MEAARQAARMEVRRCQAEEWEARRRRSEQQAEAQAARRGEAEARWRLLEAWQAQQYRTWRDVDQAGSAQAPAEPLPRRRRGRSSSF